MIETPSIVWLNLNRFVHVIPRGEINSRFQLLEKRLNCKLQPGARKSCYLFFFFSTTWNQVETWEVLMANLFQSFSSKMDVLKSPTVVLPPSLRNIICYSCFSSSPFLWTSSSHITPTNYWPLFSTIFTGLQSSPFSSTVKLPSHMRAGFLSSAHVQQFKPSRLIFSQWRRLLSSHCDPYLASLLPPLWGSTDSYLPKQRPASRPLSSALCTALSSFICLDCWDFQSAKLAEILLTASAVAVFQQCFRQLYL